MKQLSSILVVGVYALFGCSSDVTLPGGAGEGAGTSQGGNGGSPDATSVGGFTSSSGGGQPVGGQSNGGAPSTGGFSAVGGGPVGTDCEQVCVNVEACFGVTCADVMIDCNDPNFDCPASCLVDASCAELAAAAQGNFSPAIAACVQACQGGAGGAGGGGGGGSPMACGQCLFGADCLNGCFGDMACQAFAQCAQMCTNPACFDACEAANPGAAMAYTQIYGCACTNCDPECGAVMDPCNQP